MADYFVPEKIFVNANIPNGIKSVLPRPREWDLRTLPARALEAGLRKRAVSAARSLKADPARRHKPTDAGPA